MSKIHYFQRYSTVENTVTNNTLQLFARIYSYSPSRASKFLTELTGESIEIGVEINQQEPGEGSVPDGVIIQRSFKVLLESKVDSAPDEEQLIRHLDSFSGESQKVLLLLTRTGLGVEEDAIRQRVVRNRPDVIFKNVTYEGIFNVASRLFQEYETEMRSLVDDYFEYCNDVGLFDQSRYLMRIVPCGRSLAINRRHGIYFHPSDRGYTKHKYVGIYKDKAVQTLWEINSVFDVSVIDGKLTKKRIQGRETAEYDDRILSIIRDARAECGYEIEEHHRFFCGDPLDTNYKKISYGGIQGARFVNLRDVVGDFEDVKDLAEKLAGKKWL